MSEGDNGNGKVAQHQGGSITRMVGIGLSNGKTVMAPVEVWIAAIISTYQGKALEDLAATVERLSLHLNVTPLTDGMAIVNKPIIGLNV